MKNRSRTGCRACTLRASTTNRPVPPKNPSAGCGAASTVPNRRRNRRVWKRNSRPIRMIGNRIRRRIPIAASGGRRPNRPTCRSARTIHGLRNRTFYPSPGFGAPRPRRGRSSRRSVGRDVFGMEQRLTPERRLPKPTSPSRDRNNCCTIRTRNTRRGTSRTASPTTRNGMDSRRTDTRDGTTSPRTANPTRNSDATSAARSKTDRSMPNHPDRRNSSYGHRLRRRFPPPPPGPVPRKRSRRCRRPPAAEPSPRCNSR